MAGNDAKGKDKRKGDDEEVVDLAARIGSRPPVEQLAPTEKSVSPSPPAEPVDPTSMPQRLDGPVPSRRASDRPALIGADESPAQFKLTAAPSEIKPETPPPSDAVASPRTVPGLGEIDVVVTPLPTPDDWHRFELALRRVKGVSQLRPEYYRHGVAKMRVHWEGKERLAQALRSGVPGYRVRVIGEDRGTIQILVSSDNEERRPG
jgi:hypothetical protein